MIKKHEVAMKCNKKKKIKKVYFKIMDKYTYST